MIKVIKDRFYNHPIASVIIIIGYTISILLISIFISYKIQLKETALERSVGSPQNALTIGLSTNSTIDFNKFITLFDNLDKDTGIIFLGMTSYVDNTNKNNRITITGEMFFKEPEWKYPLVSGSYYTYEEVKKGDKVVLIGRDLDQYTYKNGENKYIKIGGEEYKVKGIIGRKGKVTPWDRRAHMPIKAIPVINKNEINTFHNISFILHNVHKSTNNDWNNIKTSVLEMDKEANYEVKELEQKDNVTSNTITDDSNLKFITFLVILISVINSTNITSYWINERRYEIGIRKAFGHSNFNIAILLLKESLILCFVAGTIGLIIQTILSLFLDRINEYFINITIFNLIGSVITITIIAIITSMLPIYKSLKIQPIESMKL